MKLIYCAYSILDQVDAPDWLEKLRTNPRVTREAWGLYDPARGFMGNAQMPEVAVSLSSDRKVPREVQAAHKTLRLDPGLFAPLPEVKDRMIAADHFPSTDVSFKHLYALLRSDVVLVDLTRPSHGCRDYTALYAHLFHKPVVGVSQRFVLSPWVVQRCDALVFPQNTDEIVRQILAFEPRVMAPEEPHAVESPD